MWSAERQALLVETRPVRPVAGLPRDACDCHVHVFGDPARFPHADDRVYTPGVATSGDLLTHHRALGLCRVIVVQASPYGTDNACMLDALSRLGDDARGIAVVAPDILPEDLAALHAAGICGIRLNLATSGERDLEHCRSRMQAIAGRIAAFGWHVQLYAPMEMIAAMADALAGLPVPVVLDHYAKPDFRAADIVSTSRAVLRLVESGRTYVKLSAPRRLGDPCGRQIVRWTDDLLAANPERVVWGSDWPHPRAQAGKRTDGPSGFFAEDDAFILERVLEQADRRHAVRHLFTENPANLYGFA